MSEYQQTYRWDGIEWGIAEIEDGVAIYNIFDIFDDNVPYDEVAAEKLFIQILADTVEFQWQVGLAGRSGGVEFEGIEDTFEKAAQAAYEVYYREGLSPEGKLYGIDAIR